MARRDTQIYETAKKSVDASGKPYVAGGRGGIYFRERIRPTDTAPAGSAPPRGGSAAIAWSVAVALAVIVLLPFTVSLACYGSATVHLPEGNWAKARSSIDRAIAVARAGNIAILLPGAVASSAWVLAQLGEMSETPSRLHEGEQATRRASAAHQK